MISCLLLLQPCITKDMYIIFGTCITEIHLQGLRYYSKLLTSQVSLSTAYIHLNNLQAFTSGLFPFSWVKHAIINQAIVVGCQIGTRLNQFGNKLVKSGLKKKIQLFFFHIAKPKFTNDLILKIPWFILLW